jgi:phage terminase Nu1 subunit (DNA packaging protein)
MKPKLAPDNGDVPKHVLDKRLTEARINETNRRAHISQTREKALAMQIAVAGGDLIEKALVTAQAAFLFAALRQKMLSWPTFWCRKFVGITDPHVARDRLTELVHSGLNELADMPKRITDPNWLESLDQEEEDV